MRTSPRSTDPRRLPDAERLRELREALRCRPRQALRRGEHAGRGSVPAQGQARPRLSTRATRRAPACARAHCPGNSSAHGGLLTRHGNREGFAMDYVRFGTTGLHVSRLCLGCMTYGDPGWREWVLDEAAACRSSAKPGKRASTSSIRPTCTVSAQRDRARAGHQAARPARRGRDRDQGVQPDGAAARTRRACRASTSWRRSTPR